MIRAVSIYIILVGLILIPLEGQADNFRLNRLKSGLSEAENAKSKLDLELTFEGGEFQRRWDAEGQSEKSELAVQSFSLLAQQKIHENFHFLGEVMLTQGEGSRDSLIRQAWADWQIPTKGFLGIRLGLQEWGLGFESIILPRFYLLTSHSKWIQPLENHTDLGVQMRWEKIWGTGFQIESSAYMGREKRSFDGEVVVADQTPVSISLEFENEQLKLFISGLRYQLHQRDLVFSSGAGIQVCYRGIKDSSLCQELEVWNGLRVLEQGPDEESLSLIASSFLSYRALSMGLRWHQMDIYARSDRAFKIQSEIQKAVFIAIEPIRFLQVSAETQVSSKGESQLQEVVFMAHLRFSPDDLSITTSGF